MTQNTEQNMRTRDEQVADLVEALSDEVWVPDHKSYCEKMILEAEARGAEEQRRKDGEGQEKPRAYEHVMTYETDETNERLSYSPENAFGKPGKDYSAEYPVVITPLYTRPANVAALEAALLDPATVHQNMLRGSIAKPEWDQIKHLYAGEFSAREAEIASLKEAEQLARADAARFAWVAENTGCFWYGLPGFGPLSGRTYADRMKDLRSAIDKNMARAALTREGGV